jgi:hypothetical protein
MIYYLVVNVLRHQRILGDPEVMTSYKYDFQNLTFFDVFVLVSLSTDDDHAREPHAKGVGGPSSQETHKGTHKTSRNVLHSVTAVWLGLCSKQGTLSKSFTSQQYMVAFMRSYGR